MERGAAARTDRLGSRLRDVDLSGGRVDPGVLLVALTLLVALPTVGGLLVLLLGKGRDHLVRQVALGVAVATFMASVSLWTGFDETQAGFQFVERYSWLPDFGISYHV